MYGVMLVTVSDRPQRDMSLIASRLWEHAFPTPSRQDSKGFNIGSSNNVRGRLLWGCPFTCVPQRANPTTAAVRLPSLPPGNPSTDRSFQTLVPQVARRRGVEGSTYAGQL